MSMSDMSSSEEDIPAGVDPDDHVFEGDSLPEVFPGSTWKKVNGLIILVGWLVESSLVIRVMAIAHTTYILLATNIHLAIILCQHFKEILSLAIMGASTMTPALGKSSFRCPPWVFG